MGNIPFQDSLAGVRQPSQYLGSEINTVIKDHRSVKLKVALVFPDLYEIGTSHFGMQILYHMLNNHPDVVAERVFAPGEDVEKRLRATGEPMASLETGTPLDRFDIIGVSLLYELNYTNLLTILDLAGIPFLSRRRDGTHPILLAGGPCTCNPEPVADFFDAVVIGDGEAVIMDLVREALDAGDVKSEKSSVIRAWSALTGVYIPAYYRATYDEKGLQRLEPTGSAPTSVRRAIIPNLDTAPFPDRPILPYGRPVHDRLRLELARGCTRGCRFCQAGMIYRPVRERSVDRLLSLASSGLDATGYEDVSLLSLSTGDFSGIGSLVAQLMERCEADHVALSLPSLRAGTLSPELMKLIKRVRKTGFTLAPEAGSQRLRDAINKNITEDDIHQSVENAFQLGWQLIKLYFMIGLPTETSDDLMALVRLVDDLRRIKTDRGRRGKFNVSIGPFVPKPHTPFQWSPQLTIAEARQRIDWIRSQLKLPGVQVKWQNPETSFIEGIWSRGDRKLSRLLIAAYQRGCRFDGWNDRFDFNLWLEALEETGLDPAFYVSRERSPDEPLPWDIVDIGVEKAFLVNEWQRAQEGTLTGDCRNGDCHACGVCDFDTIEPIVCGDTRTMAAAEPNPAAGEMDYIPVQMRYSKTGQARYFGHLELVSSITRALRRAKIPVRYTQGFHPKAKLSFGDPLPVGTESMDERFVGWVPSRFDRSGMIDALNRELPEGIVMHALQCSRKLLRPDAVQYRIRHAGPVFGQDRIDAFAASDEWTIERTNKKGRLKTLDLKRLVGKMERQTDVELILVLDMSSGATTRPAEVLASVFDLSDADLEQLAIVKEAMIFTANEPSSP